MEKWNYRTIDIQLTDLKDPKGRKYSAWVAHYSDGSRIEGLEKILTEEGRFGWELVNVVVGETVGENPYWSGTYTNHLIAFFKLRVQETTSQP